MANERMYLAFVPTKKAVYLGKRMGWGWYGTPKNINERIKILFDSAECDKYEGSQDDFKVIFEAESVEYQIIKPS